MLQRGLRFTSYDVWLWVPAGTGHSQSSRWTSALGLSQWKESNGLNFVTGSTAPRACSTCQAQRTSSATSRT
jgi:hypothetical protein